MFGHVFSLLFHALTDPYFYAGVALGVAAHVAIQRLSDRVFRSVFHRI